LAKKSLRTTALDVSHCNPNHLSFLKMTQILFTESDD